MNDNDVVKIILPIISSGLVERSISGVSVKQSYQPTQQGVNSGPTVYLHKISAPRYGYPGLKTTYNQASDDFDTVESIWRNPTFQITGLAIQDPSDINSITASDIVETTADILQSPVTRDTLLQSNIGILRISAVRILYFVNDKDRHEQEPSFDFTLSYRNTFTRRTPKVTRQDQRTNSVQS